MKKLCLTLVVVASCIAFTSSYTAEEMKLTEEQALRLVEQYKSREDVANTKIKEEEEKIAVLEGEIAKLDTEILAIADEIAKLHAAEPKHDIYVVKQGDWLAKLAEYSEVYGRGNYAMWPKIYKANKDLIKNPTFIKPGWNLKIPRP